ncbi:MAG TPA: hypothetical protein VMJ11_34315 [Paraburkholderia sp.]|uniref:hypothetical protein n=1 Tax=Paraburkholderia sp. TaxID=1926495 RepID=UPI002B6EE4CF|nr:hypothetical protein [Paraburkholderia sp.]HTR11649.1 hypothetical protein [Paraburkholderia sp.]
MTDDSNTHLEELGDPCAEFGNVLPGHCLDVRASAILILPQGVPPGIEAPTVMEIGATPNDERNYGVEGGQVEVVCFLWRLDPAPNMTRRY